MAGIERFPPFAFRALDSPATTRLRAGRLFVPASRALRETPQSYVRRHSLRAIGSDLSLSDMSTLLQRFERGQPFVFDPQLYPRVPRFQKRFKGRSQDRVLEPVAGIQGDLRDDALAGRDDFGHLSHQSAERELGDG